MRWPLRRRRRAPVLLEPAERGLRPMPPDGKTIAFMEGWRAFFNDRATNPYHVASDQANQWARGWHAAREHDRKEYNE